MAQLPNQVPSEIVIISKNIYERALDYLTHQPIAYDLADFPLPVEHAEDYAEDNDRDRGDFEPDAGAPEDAVGRETKQQFIDRMAHSMHDGTMTPSEVVDAIALRFHSNPTYQQVIRSLVKSEFINLKPFKRHAQYGGFLDNALNELEGHDLEVFERFTQLGLPEQLLVQTAVRKQTNDPDSERWPSFAEEDEGPAFMYIADCPLLTDEFKQAFEQSKRFSIVCNTIRKRKLEKKHLGEITLERDRYLKVIERLLESHSVGSLAVGILAATGQRTTEILKTLEFQRIPHRNDVLLQTGTKLKASLKQKLTRPEPFVMKTLVAADLVLSAFRKLRSKLTDTAAKMANARVNQVYASLINKQYHQAFDSLIGPKNKHTTAHFMRSFYVTILFEREDPKPASFLHFANQALQHGEGYQATLHYITQVTLK